MLFIRIITMYDRSEHSDVTGGQCAASLLAGPAQGTQEMDFAAPTRMLLSLQQFGDYSRAGRDQ